MQYNQVLQAVLLAQFEMQRAPGEFRPEIDLPDDIVDRALQAWQAQQQVGRLRASRSFKEFAQRGASLGAEGFCRAVARQILALLPCRPPSCRPSSWR